MSLTLSQVTVFSCIIWKKTFQNPSRIIQFGKHPIDIICWRQDSTAD